MKLGRGDIPSAGAPLSPPSGRSDDLKELSLAQQLTVAENIVLGVEPGRFGVVDRARARAIALDALGRLGHGDMDPATPAGDLSVAAQQIVEIARALASGCRVLVLDEPTSSLGRQDARRLFDLVGELRRQGLAIVYISHFIEEVKTVADRVLVLREAGSPVGGTVSRWRIRDRG